MTTEIVEHEGKTYRWERVAQPDGEHVAFYDGPTRIGALEYFKGHRAPFLAVNRDALPAERAEYERVLRGLATKVTGWQP